MNHNNLGTYEWVATADGSPSLRALGVAPEGGAEWMHSSGGAFAESVYIYGEAIQKALDQNLTRFLSVGLGLGYNELLVMAYALKQGASLSRIHITSFEADSRLVDHLMHWLRRQPMEDEAAAEWSKVYDLMLGKFSEEFGSETAAKLPSLILKKLEDGEWQIHGRLDASTAWTTTFHCILYDAFSSKSTPELWTEEFLEKLLNEATAPNCVLATYACTGALKRSLAKSGFEVVVKKGFHVKKQSTFAYRLEPTKAL